MTPNTPILTLGKYQLVHRSNDDYTRLETIENNTSGLFSFLRLLAGLKTALACFYVVTMLTSLFNTPLFLTLIGLIVFLFLVVFGTRSFFSLFKIINTKNPTPPTLATHPTINKFDWACVSFLAVIGCFNTYLNHSSAFETVLKMDLIHSISVVLVIVGVPYFIYQFRALLLK